MMTMPWTRALERDRADRPVATSLTFSGARIIPPTSTGFWRRLSGGGGGAAMMRLDVRQARRPRQRGWRPQSCRRDRRPLWRDPVGRLDRRGVGLTDWPRIDGRSLGGGGGVGGTSSMTTPPIGCHGAGRTSVARSGTHHDREHDRRMRERARPAPCTTCGCRSEIDGRVTSPNRSRGMSLSLCLCAMPGRVNAC